MALQSPLPKQTFIPGNSLKVRGFPFDLIHDADYILLLDSSFYYTCSQGDYNRVNCTSVKN